MKLFSALIRNDDSKLSLGCNSFSLHLQVWKLFSVLCAIVYVLERCHRGSLFWRNTGWTESSELAAPIYAERVIADTFFRTYFNSWSNLAYNLVGTYAMVLGYNDLSLVSNTFYDSGEPYSRGETRRARSFLIQFPALSLFFGASLHILGFGSLLFHASLSRFGQQLDVSAMYLPLLTLASVSIARLHPEIVMVVPSWLSFPVCNNAENNTTESMLVKSRHRGRYYTFPSWQVLLCLSTIIEGYLFAYKWTIDSKHLLTNMILGVFLLGLISYLLKVFRHAANKSSGRLPMQWWLMSLAAVGLGHTVREMDVHHRFGGPDDVLQGHALWHLLTAIALACMYMFYRFEDCGGQASESMSSSQLI
eukprot:gene27490-36272_t